MTHVHNADAAQLHVIAYELRRCSDESIAPYAADIDSVVGDELVSALYELKRRFALADA